MSVIKVKPWGEGQGDHVLIEESDFNDEVHERFEEEKKDKPLAVNQIKDALKEKGIEIPDGAKKADLLKLLEATEED